MYYLDENLNLSEANENKVYRVFGGDSDLEGGFVTPNEPQNPIEAREELGLSQHDFCCDDGSPIRNMASHIAEGTIYTDDDGRIINLDGEVTDNVLDFTEVQPTTDMDGGGLEYHLQDDFNDVVQVDNISELQHEPTEGWLNYVDIESEVINDTEQQPEDSLDDEDNPDWWVEDHSEEAIDDLIGEEEYNIQSSDVEDEYFDAVDIPDDDPVRERADEDWWCKGSYEEESIDQLIDDEEFESQIEDVNTDVEEDIEDNYSNNNENEY